MAGDEKKGKEKNKKILVISIILWVVIYALLKLLVSPPIPFSVMSMYMTLVTIAILLYVSIFQDDCSGFFDPILDFFRGGEGALNYVRWGVLIAVPILVGFRVYSGYIPSYVAPITSRTVHPAPPIEFAGMANPYPWTKKNIATGKGIFTALCSPCHGQKMDGGGVAAAGLVVKPANFTDVGTIAQLQESYVYWRIKKGGIGLPVEGTPWNTPMPRWEGVGRKGEVRLPDEVIWKLVMWLYTGTGYKPRTWE
ncbi:MAG: c-type cytochrome [Nitrospirota bacterium]